MSKENSNTKQLVISLTFLLIFLFGIPFSVKKLSGNVNSNDRVVKKLKTPAMHVEKTKAQKLPPLPDIRWKKVAIRPGDTLTHLFKREHLSLKSLHQLLDKTHYRDALKQINPRQALYIVKDKDLEWKRIKLVLSAKDTLLIKKEDREHYVESIEKKTTRTQNKVISATINGSLYQTALKEKLPLSVIENARVALENKVNFSRDIRDGDKIRILYEEELIGDKKINQGPILAVQLDTRRKNYTAIRYGKSKVNYYGEKGEALSLSFDRYPVKFSHIGSVFNLHRYHPILHVTRAHRGIDLAAALGSPIHAVADGIVTQIGVNGGYGNMVKLRHSKTYETIYAHMLRFNRKIKRGSKVLRGEVLGYVGQTGLATAPHCHFEFHVNNVAVNPATVKLPSLRNIPTSQQADYQQTKKNYLSLLNNSAAISKAG